MSLSYLVRPAPAAPDVFEVLRRGRFSPHTIGVILSWWYLHGTYTGPIVGANRWPAIREAGVDWSQVPVILDYQAGQAGPAWRSGEASIRLYHDHLVPTLAALELQPTAITIDESAFHLDGELPVDAIAANTARCLESYALPAYVYEPYILGVAKIRRYLEGVVRSTQHVRAFVLDINMAEFDALDAWSRWREDVRAIRQWCVADLGIDFLVAGVAQHRHWSDPPYDTAGYLASLEAFVEDVAPLTGSAITWGSWGSQGDFTVPATGPLFAALEARDPHGVKGDAMTNEAYQRVARQMFRALDNRVGLDLGDLEHRRRQNQCGRYLYQRLELGKTHLQAAGQVWPEPAPPPPGTGNGMDHELDSMAARVIGYPGGSSWFLNSRLRPGALSDAEVVAVLADPSVGDAVWYSLSTGHRPPMNETPYDCRTDWQATVDRMGLITEQGVQVIPELGTQEFFAQILGRNMEAYLDYCLDIAERLAGLNLCKLLFPFRELTDQEAWTSGASGDQRVRWANDCLLAAQRGAPGHAIGIHLRPLEAPPVAPVSIAAGLTRPYWLAQWPFDKAVDGPTSWEDDDHRTRFTDAAEWHQYWAVNRAQHIPGLKTIAFEHSLPPNSAGYPGISAAAAQVRGQYLLDHAPAVVADYSGGASRL